MLKIRILSFFLFVASTNISAASDELMSSYAEARGVAIATMDEMYGENNYIRKYDCWRFVKAEDEIPYCMSFSKLTLVSQYNTDYLYILASNEAHIPNTDYDYSRDVLGLVGVFILKKDGNNWIKDAFNKEIFLELAHFGSTGTEDAILSELGENYWGWIFSNGNQNMGSWNYNYTILSKVNTSIDDISGMAIPSICDAESQLKDILYTYKLSFTKKAKTKMYPLVIKEYKNEKFIKSYTSAFDFKNWKYIAPKVFCNNK